MNKVILGLGLLASTAAICLVGHGVQYQLHSNNRVLARRLRDAESRLAESQSNVTEIEQRLGARQDEVNRARSDFETARNEAQHAAPPELDPAREGVWPATQPYFYLAKSRLKDVGYKPFSDDDRITVPAAALFATTAQERAAVENAAAEFRRGLNALELQSAEKVEPAPGVNTESYREVGFRIQPVTNEISRLREQFRSAVSVALGAERASLFLERVADWLDELGERTRQPGTIITLEARRSLDGEVWHQLHFRGPNGSSAIGFLFPIEPSSPLWRYRHLFGDQPLIPLPGSIQSANPKE